MFFNEFRPTLKTSRPVYFLVDPFIGVWVGGGAVGGCVCPFLSAMQRVVVVVVFHGLFVGCSCLHYAGVASLLGHLEHGAVDEVDDRLRLHQVGPLCGS